MGSVVQLPGSRAQLSSVVHQLNCSVACGVWNFPRPGIEPCLLSSLVDSLPLSHQGSPTTFFLMDLCVSNWPFLKNFFFFLYLAALIGS